jgi:four helix bundle protein
MWLKVSRLTPLGCDEGTSIAEQSRVSRDHRKLRVFALADALVLDIYQLTKDRPGWDSGILGQLRRAAVSTAANIVEGSTRSSAREYAHFVNISLGSAAETRYLLDLAHRLVLIPRQGQSDLDQRCYDLICCLKRLFDALKRLDT